MSTFRAFIALELPDSLRKQIAVQIRTVAQANPYPFIRWVSVENIYLTAKFLGEIEEDRIPGMEKELAAIASSYDPFPIEVNGLRIFPTISRPRGIWLSIQENSELKRLVAQIETGLQALAFPREPKPFDPHLTLARLRRNLSQPKIEILAEYLNELPAFTVKSKPLRDLILYRSDLLPDGARYTQRLTFPLTQSKKEN